MPNKRSKANPSIAAGAENARTRLAKPLRQWSFFYRVCLRVKRPLKGVLVGVSVGI
jgi:hypothetical protein